MQAYLVGLKCYSHKFGCGCNDDLTEEQKAQMSDDNCYHTIVHVEKQEDITLDVCLRQQGATEYEHAVEIWTEYKIIEHIPHLSV